MTVYDSMVAANSMYRASNSPQATMKSLPAIMTSHPKILKLGSHALPSITGFYWFSYIHYSRQGLMPQYVHQSWPAPSRVKLGCDVGSTVPPCQTTTWMMQMWYTSSLLVNQRPTWFPNMLHKSANFRCVIEGSIWCALHKELLSMIV